MLRTVRASLEAVRQMLDHIAQVRPSFVDIFHLTQTHLTGLLDPHTELRGCCRFVQHIVKYCGDYLMIPATNACWKQFFDQQQKYEREALETVKPQ